MAPPIDQRALAETIEWLNDGCPNAPLAEDALRETCVRLTAGGVALIHGAIFVRILHPVILGRRFIWHPKTGVTSETVGYELFDNPEYQTSPIKQVSQTGRPLRRRLGDPDCPMDFSFLDKFRAEGVTDFLALPLRSHEGHVHTSAWMSKQPGGFSDEEIAALETIAKPLARMVEVRSLRRTAISLLDTYVGGQAGRRILDGHIRRGDIEAIHAAIWLSDMRGFTARADRMAVTDLVSLLNRYFDCQVPLIRDHGGEVLKFMGDGLLAIFPTEGTTLAAACRNAFAAARKIEAEVAGADWAGLEEKGAVRFGVALHVGEVLYGNVGSENRLDFTCIGPAVNIAARIEKVSGEIGRTILASREFALHCGPELESGALVPVGEFTLKGVLAPQQVYGTP